jgi:L-2-hydroxyglutarate oxidase LhgO
MIESVDAVVIGAGVIGLAVGRALAVNGLETVVLERANAIGTATSSRNSEVIHAGIYYPSGSLKAALCVAGREQLYAYCAERSIAFRRCGKLLVATSAEQCGRLAHIQSQAARNAVHDLRMLDPAQIRAIEPELNVIAALYSPSTGIVDSHGFMLALHGDLESKGGALALLSPVMSISADAGRHGLQVGGKSPMVLSARVVVNAAGLWAPQVAATVAALPPPLVPWARYAKGNYFSLTTRAPFSHLIYPVPEEAGLGVHLTLDLAGRARFGPDVQWIEPESPDAIDYRVDGTRLAAFEAEIRRYWPGLPTNSLQADYSGVRPKLQLQGAQSNDFQLQGPAEHGVAGLMNLYGIESPGLTASLALADEVLRRLDL